MTNLVQEIVNSKKELLQTIYCKSFGKSSNDFKITERWNGKCEYIANITPLDFKRGDLFLIYSTKYGFGISDDTFHQISVNQTLLENIYFEKTNFEYKYKIKFHHGELESHVMKPFFYENGDFVCCPTLSNTFKQRRTLEVDLSKLVMICEKIDKIKCELPTLTYGTGVGFWYPLEDCQNFLRGTIS